jgi:hypothetical protein
MCLDIGGSSDGMDMPTYQHIKELRIKILLLTYETIAKFYDRAFKEKAVQLKGKT